MNILFVTRTFPYPANAGDLKFNAGLIEALSAFEEVNLHVFCGSSVPENPRTAPRVKWHGPGGAPGASASVRALLGALPRAAERAMTPRAIVSLAALVAADEFDGVLLSESCVAPALQILATVAAPKIYISHNVDADIRPMIAARVRNPILRAIQKADAEKYRRMEMALIGSVDGITAITPEDAARYAALSPHVPCIVLKPGYDGPPVAKTIPFSQSRPIAVVVGSFEWNAKLHNLKTILTAYNRYIERTGAQSFGLRIAGRIAPHRREALRRAHPTVEFTGEFDTLAQVTSDSRIALVLEYLGGGFKMKILDYVFSGLPIVGLNAAMAGSDLRPDKDYVLAASADDAFGRVSALIDDEVRLGEIADNALHRVSGRFEWRDRGRDLIDFLKSVRKSAALAKSG